MLFSTLKTMIIEKHTPGNPAEGGYFEIEVHLDMEELAKSHSPRQAAFHAQAVILGNAIKSTEVPREFWYVSFPLNIQREFNLPAQQRMSV